MRRETRAHALTRARAHTPHSVFLTQSKHQDIVIVISIQALGTGRNQTDFR